MLTRGNPARPGSWAAIFAFAVSVGLLLHAAAPAPAAKRRADLSITRAAAVAGERIALSAVTANRGRARAKASRTRFLLSRDAKAGAGDVTLATAKVRALRPRGTRRSSRRVVLPAVLAPGAYRVLACADATRAVRESNERNNCRAAAGALKVGGVPDPFPLPGVPGVPGVPDPAPVPTATPEPTATASPVPTATASPEPTATASPDPTPTPSPEPTPTTTPDTGAGMDDVVSTELDLGDAPDPTVPVDTADLVKDLYTGDDPLQRGVDPEDIDPVRVAVLRGRIVDRAGEPVAGAEVRVLDHPEYGETTTRQDGGWDLAVNGGGLLTVQVDRSGWVTSQRATEVPWLDFAVVDDIVLVPRDAAVTAVDLAKPGMKVHQSTLETDSDGSRHATVLFPEGVLAALQMPDGTSQPVTSLHVRATEFTVGASGPQAMPGELPPTSAYTYAVELDTDESAAAGATGVAFSGPLFVHVENFRKFPVGEIIPVGYYNRDTGAWEPEPNGAVIGIVSESDGAANVDIDGDGAAEDAAKLAAAGITQAEREKLAQLFDAGQSTARFPVTHFSPHDPNLPRPFEGDYGPDPDEPPVPEPEIGEPREPEDDGRDQEKCQSGSIIFCESQTLGERVEVAGTGMALHYSSDRAKRTESRLEIPLTGADIDPRLDRVILNGTVGGHHFSKRYRAGRNLKYLLRWDGSLAYSGARPTGPQPVEIEVCYQFLIPRTKWYPPAPTPDEIIEAFGQFSQSMLASGARRTIGERPNEVRMERCASRTTSIRSPNATHAPFGLGGWSLSRHHVYDRERRSLQLGTGETIGEAMGLEGVVRTLTITRSATALAAEPDGSILVGDPNYQAMGRTHGGDSPTLSRVSPTGEAVTLAGLDGQHEDTGDGGPATAAALSRADDIGVLPDGSILLAASGRLRRIDGDGVIRTFAGTGAEGPTGDGGPATSAAIAVRSFGVAEDGTVYVSDYGSTADQRITIRKIAPDGTIETIAGDRFVDPGGGAAAPTHDVAAPFADLRGLKDIDVVDDGGLILGFGDRFMRLGPDGVVRRVAGLGESTAEGAHALETQVNNGPWDPYTVAPDGRILYVETDNSKLIRDATGDYHAQRIREIDVDGRVRTIAGARPVKPADGEGRPVQDGALGRLADLAYLPDGRIAFIRGRDLDWGNLLQVIATAMPGPRDLEQGELLIPARDGTEAYVFDAAGRHRRTVHALTGAVTDRFTYGLGGLVGIEDRNGRITTIERAEDGRPLAIVAPGGQRTKLVIGGSTDDPGLLKAVEGPGGQRHDLDYTTGILTRVSDPAGGVHEFGYDDDNRLVRDAGPNRVVTLSSTHTQTASTVTVKTGMGRTTVYRTEVFPSGRVVTTETDPSGQVTTHDQLTDRSVVSTFPDGSVMTVRQSPDPRFGMLSPYASETKLVLPSGRTVLKTARRRVTLADNDPLRVTSFEQRETVSGAERVSTYTGATRTLSTVSPEGRKIATVFDAKARVAQVTPGGTSPVDYSYDLAGRLVKTAAASGGGTPVESTTYAYDDRDRVVTQTNGANEVTRFEYDLADRVTAKILPDETRYEFGYDGAGELTSVKMPSGATHAIGVDAAGRMTGYTAPGNAAVSFAYDADGMQSSRTMPGRDPLANHFDAGGRITGVTTAEAVVGYGYAAGGGPRPGVLTRDPVAGGPTETITYEHDGPIVTGVATAGSVAASLAHHHDPAGRPTGTTLTLDGTDYAEALELDDDGAILKWGAFDFARGGPDGATSRITGPGSTLDFGYDPLGRMNRRTLKFGAAQRYDASLAHDGAGRIVKRTEVIEGSTQVVDYHYDDAGRLTGVDRDGTAAERYGYDANGNRTSATYGSGPAEPATYDAQDRLLGRAGVAYAHDAAGHLTGRGGDSFAYGTRGELLRATVGGVTVTYAYDALGRRASRTQGGQTTGYVYGDPAAPLRVTAIRAPGGEVTTLSYDEEGLLIAYVRAGARSHVATDPAGTPRLVTSADGTIVKRLEHDAFGRELSDSAPAVEVPLGFAGGLPDELTGLVHFGFRDYDPAAGRWTSRDPALFGGGQGNLYVYAGNDPVAMRDPTGLSAFCANFSVFKRIGAGGELCVDFAGRGASFCGEVGFGQGGGVGAGVAEKLAVPASEIVAAFGVGVEGLVGGGGEMVLDKCGGLNQTYSLALGPLEFSDGKVGVSKFDIGTYDKIDLSASVKLVGRKCWAGTLR